MKTHLSFKKLCSLYDEGFSIPLWEEVVSPLSPWELYQEIHPQSPHSFFLDSLRYAPPHQRYSYLGWDPYQRVSFRAGELRVEGEEAWRERPRDVLGSLRRLFRRVRIPRGFSFDFFTGGAVGYWGYELAQEFDRISLRRKPGLALPDLALLLFRDGVAFDHKRRIYTLVSWMVPKKGQSFEEAYRAAERKLAERAQLLRGTELCRTNGHFELANFHSKITKDRFEAMVRKAKDYILDGDIYQANLSQRFDFRFQGSPLKLYERLRALNPSPFAAVLHWGPLFIASSSPELLVEKRGNRCITCPIAGTRPRGRRTEETRRLSRELLANEKERAEHLMLVDLERNDLGRVSEWRSVRVKDLMRIEKYARVIHIVSEVMSRLRPEMDAWDVIRAMFPGGTITGCPKIRSMEIIDELEPMRRGIYTGSMGYVGFDGNLKLNIAIRTLVLLRNRGYLQVGAGIVADSDPEREYEETLAKGEALAEALVSASEPSLKI